MSDAQSEPSPVLKTWRRVSALPGGKQLFSKVVSHKAPYFNSIGARVQELRPNYARVTMRKRRAVQNHIGTVHAIAVAARSSAMITLPCSSRRLSSARRSAP